MRKNQIARDRCSKRKKSKACMYPTEKVHHEVNYFLKTLGQKENHLRECLCTKSFAIHFFKRDLINNKSLQVG